VDDDVDFAQSLADIITAEGYDVEVVLGAEAAIASMRRGPSDVAVVDVNLGAANGVDLVQALHNEFPKVQSILLTAYASADSVLDALHLRVYDYLRKPVAPKTFLLTLDHCFESIALRREKERAEEELAARNAELENINRRLRRIVETATELTMAVRVDDLDPRLLRAIAENLAAGGGSLFYIRNDALELAHSLDPGHTPFTIPLVDLPADCLISRALQTREPVLIQDVSIAKVRRSGWSGYTSGSAIVFPLVEDDKPFGVITLHNKENDPFTPQDLDLGRIIISLVTEVLRERRANEELQRSESRFRKLVEHSSDLVTVLDGDGIFRYESPSVKSVLGWEPGEILDTSVFSLMHPEDKDLLLQLMQDETGDDEIIHFEHRFRHRDGHYLVLDSYGRNLVNDPSIRGYVINSRDVTARNELAERLRTLFDQAPTAFFLVDFKGVFVDLNEAATELIGLKRDEVIGGVLPESSLLRDRDLERAQDLFRRSGEGEATGPVELTLHRLDGSVIVIEVFTRPVTIHGVAYVLGTARDITVQRQAQLALVESEERYRSVVETTFDALVISQDEKVKWMNRETSDLLGMDIDEVIDTPAISSVVEHQKQFALKIIQTVQQTRTPEGPHEISIARSDGSIRTLEWRSVPVEFDGRAAVMHIGRDIHEQRRAEQMLKESEAKYRTLFESAVDGICILDGEIFTDCNPAFCGLFDLPRQEIIGKTPYEVSPEFQPSGPRSDDLARIRIEAARNGSPQRFEWQHMRADGSMMDAEVLLGPIDLNNRRFVLAIVRDMTQQKLAAAREREHTNQLFQAAKMVSLGTLVSGVAHEINNPNNFIRLSTENLAELWPDIAKLLRRVHEDEPVQIKGVPLDAAEEIVDSVIKGLNEGSVRIERLVQSLKEYSRRDDGDLDQEVNLNDVVESAHTIVKSAIRKATRHYSFERSEVPTIHGNYHQIEQVVINLLTNACQALPDPEKAIRVATTYDDQSGLVQVVVEDQGIGIPEENLLHLTDPFFTTKRNIGGTGLGLSVSQRIVQSHGGELSFQSSSGSGTTAVLTLPTE